MILQNRRYERLLGQAGIPPAYESMSFDTFDATRVKRGDWLLQKVRQSINEDCKGIYFTGRPGVGKTHLAISMLRDWLQQGRAGAFITLPSLMRSLRDGIDGKNLTERINLLCEVDFLVLDDFGAERATPWTIEQLFVIVNERYINNKKTVVTSNLSMEAVEDKLGDGGERICSRLMGMCDIVEIHASDYRIVKHKKR